MEKIIIGFDQGFNSEKYRIHRQDILGTCLFRLNGCYLQPDGSWGRNASAIQFSSIREGIGSLKKVFPKARRVIDKEKYSGEMRNVRAGRCNANYLFVINQ